MGEARSTAALGLTYLMTDELDEARQLIDEAMTMFQALDDRWGQDACHTCLDVIAEVRLRPRPSGPPRVSPTAPNSPPGADRPPRPAGA